MARFSQQSWRKLQTCNRELRLLFANIVQTFDCKVLEGMRTADQQRENVRRGVSKTLESKHLREFSANPEEGVDAVDVAPWPLKWPDRSSDEYVKQLALFYYFGGYVLGYARGMKYDVRWGGDWDGDREILDQNFDDLVHFEMIGGKDVGTS